MTITTRRIVLIVAVVLVIVLIVSVVALLGWHYNPSGDERVRG